jgi:uncharacterized protein (DUF427 family)
MPRAIWNGAVIAEAPDDAIQLVEGNIYFPMSSVKQEYLQASDKVTTCHWKGSANYFDIVVNGDVNEDAAWIYWHPFDAAKQITGHLAFWRGVQVEK